MALEEEWLFCGAALETETRGIEMILTSDQPRLLGGGPAQGGRAHYDFSSTFKDLYGKYKLVVVGWERCIGIRCASNSNSWKTFHLNIFWMQFCFKLEWFCLFFEVLFIYIYFFYWCSTIDLKSALLHANKMTTFKRSFAGISLFTSSSRNICKRKQIPHEATFFSNTVILQSALSLFYRHLCFQWISSKFCTSYNILNTYNSLQKEKKRWTKELWFFCICFLFIIIIITSSILVVVIIVLMLISDNIIFWSVKMIINMVHSC